MFREYHEYESGDRGCGWGDDVGVVEVVSGVEMGVGVGGAGNKEDDVVSSGGEMFKIPQQ